jgi:hypothetical protein
MEFRELQDEPASPDNQESLAHLEAQAWIEFVAAAAKYEIGINDKHCYRVADEMLGEFRKRFLPKRAPAEPEGGR